MQLSFWCSLWLDAKSSCGQPWNEMSRQHSAHFSQVLESRSTLSLVQWKKITETRLFLAVLELNEKLKVLTQIIK